MQAQDFGIRSVYLRGYLAGIRKITGAQYPRLLENCNLGQYSNRYPPLSMEVVATGEQLVQLSGQIYKALSSDMYLLFLRNFGRSFAQSAATLPGLKEKVEGFLPVKSQSALQGVLKLAISRVGGLTVGEEIVVSEIQPAEGVEIVFRNCLHAEINRALGLTECTIILSFYKELLYRLTGQRFTVTETSCGAASGGPDCFFLIK